jgi:hypothetical protein
MVFTIATVCVLLGSAGAGAQPLSPYRQYSGNVLINGNLKPVFQKQWDGSGPRSLVPLSLSASSFRSVVGGPFVHKRLAASAQGLAGDQRQELETALLGLLKGYEHLLDQQDETQLKNNLAGAFNFLFLHCYYVLKNGQSLTEAQQASMLEQLNTAIGMGLSERRLSDRDKQELYEAAVLSGSIILGLYNEGRDLARPEQMKTARELAKELLEQMMGITFEKVQVTDDAVRVH